MLTVPERELPVGRGFEVETLINMRVAKLGSSVAEVPSSRGGPDLGREQPQRARDGCGCCASSSKSATRQQPKPVPLDSEKRSRRLDRRGRWPCDRCSIDHVDLRCEPLGTADRAGEWLAAVEGLGPPTSKGERRRGGRDLRLHRGPLGGLIARRRLVRRSSRGGRARSWSWSTTIRPLRFERARPARQRVTVVESRATADSPARGTPGSAPRRRRS